MTFNQRIQAAKPYLGGFILGLIVAPIIAFSAGWVTTAGARTAAVETARIETLSGICSTTALSLAAAQRTDLATLKGFENRAKREELIAAAMSGLQVPADLLTRVTNGCNRTLA